MYKRSGRIITFKTLPVSQYINSQQITKSVITGRHFLFNATSIVLYLKTPQKSYAKEISIVRGAAKV